TNNIFENVYKFNAKELDESTGYYYYGARYYDPGTSVFLSVDPLAEKFPGMSPYVYVANNPIRYIDPDGRDIVIPTSLKGSERRQIMRNLGKLTNDKLSYDKLTGQVIISKQRTGSKTKGTELISRVVNSSNTMTITVGAPGSGNSESDVNSSNAISGVGSYVNVSFDPTSNPDILTVDPKTGNVSGKKRPNQIGLGHEIIHGERSMRGEAIDYNDMGTHTYQDANGNTVTQTVPKEELATVGLKHNTSKDITENDLRNEQGKTKNKQRGAY
ncbi:RHS repeat-associated core domain-containing protein, partial [Flavobacterium sp. HSC-61S13]|uniref:RHS repeat-associated core domain-containing protein n=1 Tax=Flavobacterium sp. HSC-61S13 TaxID=2910963 RepID=UPI00209F2B02